MGKKWTSGFAPNPKKDLKHPGAHIKRRVGELGDDLKGPQAPGPTDAEIQLQNRQREELARLDEDENVRVKRGLRGQVGSRRLLASARRSKAATTGGGSSSGGGSGGTPRIPNGGFGRVPSYR